MPLSTTTTSSANSVNPRQPIVAEELSGKKRITQYLKDSSKYDSKKKRWYIPSRTSLEEDLHHPFEEIISDILGYFEYTETRSVVRSANANMPHEEVKGVPRWEDDDEWEFKSSPDIVVTGHGKIEKEVGYNFGPADHDWRTRPTYTNLVTPFEVTLDRDFEEEVNFLQIGVYARASFSNITANLYTPYLYRRNGHVSTFSIVAALVIPRTLTSTRTPRFSFV
ncbi:hypothetical protein CPC08DRAFT_527717 [Agrocybe pediades]|nr:hypothetical protein CPC08DRAFT_527717 [Agrocybe pediades]